MQRKSKTRNKRVEVNWELARIICQELSIPILPLNKSLGLKTDAATLSILKEENGEKKLTCALIDIIRNQNNATSYDKLISHIENFIIKTYSESAYSQDTLLPKLKMVVENILFKLQAAKKAAGDANIAINPSLVKVIIEILKNAQEYINISLDRHEPHPETIQLCSSTIELSAFLKNHCHEEKNGKKQKINTDETLLNAYQNIISFYINCNKLDLAETCLHDFKVYLNINNYIDAMLTYYSYVIDVNLAKENFRDLKQAYLKYLSKIDNFLNKDYNILYFVKFTRNTLEDILKNHRQHALFFSRILKQIIEKSLNAANKEKNKKLITTLTSEEKSCLENLKVLKNQLIKDTYDQLLKYEDESFKVKIIEESGKNTIYFEIVNSEHLSPLIKILRLRGIAFTADKAAYKIKLEKTLDTSVKKLIKSTVEWKSECERREVNKITTISPSSSVIPKKMTESLPSSSEPCTSTAILPEEFVTRKPKRYQQSSPEQSTSGSNTQKKTAEIIDWNKPGYRQVPVFNASTTHSKVYRLQSNYGGKLFVFINPELNKMLKASHALARIHLHKMCEHGRVLGNSIKKKGFILSGQDLDKTQSRKTEPSTTPPDCTVGYLKGKHSTADYRFFGRIVRTTVINNKHYNLYEIDGFSPTHKTKQPTYF